MHHPSHLIEVGRIHCLVRVLLAQRYDPVERKSTDAEAPVMVVSRASGVTNASHSSVNQRYLAWHRARVSGKLAL